MSSSDTRPYAVSDALTPDALPRIVIEVSQAAAVSHVVRGRFSAAPLTSMDLLMLQARGAAMEDPRGSLPRPPTGPGAPLPPDLGPYPPAAEQTAVAPPDPPYLPAALNARPPSAFLTALASDEASS